MTSNAVTQFIAVRVTAVAMWLPLGRLAQGISPFGDALCSSERTEHVLYANLYIPLKLYIPWIVLLSPG